MSTLQPGDVVTVRALHADGQPYRWWDVTIEAMELDRVVTVHPSAITLHQPSGDWSAWWQARTFYWLERPYNLVEIYGADGRFEEIYVHIASPPAIEGSSLTYTDHELDVNLRPGGAPEILDEDEFEEACSLYGYSPEFQAACRRTVEEVIDLIQRWQPAGAPY